MTNLEMFFNPKSIAIIGASRSSNKVGGIVLNNLVKSKFLGKIYPVNPNGDLINNLKCFSNIASLPEIPDLTLIALPAVLVIEALVQLAHKGAKNIVIYAAGFKETGNEGLILEEKIKEIANDFGLNILGPNCLGFVNNSLPLNATFGQVVNKIGRISFITQSGAIASSLFDFCASTNLGFNKFITLGNKTVLNENDFLDFFKKQEKNEPIGLYLESISDGKNFLKIVKKISTQSPVFIIKPGKTKEAAKAMQSHTGAIAGSDKIFSQAIIQAGAIHCQTLEDFFDLTRCFAWQNIPTGPRIAIISNAGGPAVISADAVIEHGLELAKLSDQTKKLLEAILPRSASFLNPVDVLGDALADRIAKATEITLQSSEVDALVIILTPQAMTEIEKSAELIGQLSKKYGKPIFCSFIGGTAMAKGEAKLNEYLIPSFSFPERAISCIAKMWQYQKYRNEQKTILDSFTPFTKANSILSINQYKNQNTLNNNEINDLFIRAQIKTPESAFITSLDQANKFTSSFGYPVVLKISAVNLIHKTDVGGVFTNIRSSADLNSAWNQITQNIKKLDFENTRQANVQIQKQIENGVELIVGVKRDPNFGPVLLFGAGGTLAELISDQKLFLLPISLSETLELVKKSKIGTLLTGYRDKKKYNLEKLYDLIYKLTQIVEANELISEIEINPVIVTENNAYAVDGKVVLLP